jgi:ClpP class serine protease
VVTDTDARFQALVAANRHLDPAKVKELAGGRVYDGEDAVKLGLADGFGTLSIAVEKARALAHEPEALPLERYPQRSGLLARLGLVDSYLGPVPTSLRLWSEVAASPVPVILAWSNLHP